MHGITCVAWGNLTPSSPAVRALQRGEPAGAAVRASRAVAAPARSRTITIIDRSPSNLFAMYRPALMGACRLAWPHVARPCFARLAHAVYSLRHATAAYYGAGGGWPFDRWPFDRWVAIRPVAFRAVCLCRRPVKTAVSQDMFARSSHTTSADASWP
jgi:hypothetical protein